MRIAQIAPIWYSIPPKKNIGGAEYIVGELTAQLHKLGHDVTLFATGDSITNAQLVSFVPKGVGENGLPSGREFFLYPLLHFIKSLDYISKHNFDIIHCHFSTLADYILFGLVRDIPNIVITNHQVLPSKDIDPNRFEVFQEFKNLRFVNVSKTQQRQDFPVYSVVPNGIQLPQKTVSNNSESIVWMSRIAPQKGLLEAITTAESLNKNFSFAGSIKRDEDKAYLEKCLQHVNDDKVKYKGIVRDEDKNNFLGNGKLFLFPIQWEEPFGLVIVEAMANGTPVVAYANGAAVELIEDGKTGFLVNESEEKKRGNFIVKKTGMEGLREAVERVYSLKGDEYTQVRKQCRKQVEDNYTIEKMTDNYLHLYKRAINYTI